MSLAARVLALSALVAVAACVPPDLQALRDGIPESKELTVPLPGDGSVEGGTAQQPLLGQTADMYKVTRDVTAGINGGVVWVLALVHAVVQLPPTTHQGNVYTWGPSEPKNLEAKNNYKLVATKNTDGSVSYDLFAKRTDEAESAFRPVISGTHVKGVPGRSGKGTLRLDFDASHSLNDAKDDVGQADVTYGFAAGVGYQVAVHFTQVKDGNSGKRIDADYRFQQPDAGPGSFEFQTQKDLQDDGTIESLVVRSRWETSGRGRSDVKASGGSLAQEATISECWSDDFKRTFVNYSYDPAKNEGEASSCAFGTPSYASL